MQELCGCNWLDSLHVGSRGTGKVYDVSSGKECAQHPPLRHKCFLMTSFVLSDYFYIVEEGSILDGLPHARV